MKPRKAPSADLNACLGGLFAINSPRNAPARGPSIIPQMPNTKIPTVKPRKAPIIPYLLALYLLAPNIGVIKSNSSESNIKMKKTTVVVIEILSKPVPNA